MAITPLRQHSNLRSNYKPSIPNIIRDGEKQIEKDEHSIIGIW
jgi:hypothetical protein